MTNEPEPKPCAKSEMRISCQRVPKKMTVGEHRDCPYCFGDSVEVARGDYERFCDYWRAFDSVSFGFPENHGRYEWRTTR